MHNTTTFPNFHVLIVKNIGWTDKLPARVKIISEKFKQSIIIPYSDKTGTFDAALETSKEWLIKNGHNVIGQGEGKNHDYVICDHVDNSFKPLK